MSKKDGGPAFPIYTPDMNVGDDAGPGMSLCDWFAGQALPSFIERHGPDSAAVEAYRYADAMLAARALRARDEGK